MNCFTYLHITTFFIVFTLHVNNCLSRDHRYNPNSDFLAHESGGITPSPKKDYNDDFPALRTPSTQFTQSSTKTISISTPKPQSGKRDYVAPQRQTSSPSTTTKSTTNAYSSSSGTTSAKRDYVSPQLPSLKTSMTMKPTTNAYTSTSRTTSAKRDYVSAQFPSLKPAGTTSLPSSSANQQGNGKIKDLINFFDSKTQSGPVTSKPPDYSSVVRGSGNQVSSSTTSNTLSTHKSSNPTPKPMSWSSIISGPNKPNSIAVTPAGTSGSTKPPVIDSRGTTKKPIVLPSSIANNKNQVGNSNTVSDTELQTLSEDLLKKDTNNVAKYVTVDYQEKTTAQSKDDKAPLPLLNVAPEVWNIPTIEKFLPLLDNYERDTLINEHVTSQERNEENAFMDLIMSTNVIRHLMTFLKEKGYVTPDPKQQRDFMKQMWFGLYSRGKGKISSSGFEHIFVSELKNGEVSGLHNWIYFAKEEVANRVNYLGYLKYTQFNDKGAVLKMHFNQQGVDKPVDTMFIGTSPELEMALYTLCFVTRVGEDCNLKLGSKDVNIITHNFRYRSKNYIGSAYPQI